jgi:hypothetical protein
MARKNSVPVPTWLIVVAAALVLLAILNPSQADFKSYMERTAAAKTQDKVSGKLGAAIGSLSAGVAGAVSSAYKRQSFVFCSSYVSRAADGSALRSYLGIAKLFVRLK